MHGAPGGIGPPGGPCLFPTRIRRMKGCIAGNHSPQEPQGRGREKGIDEATPRTPAAGFLPPAQPRLAASRPASQLM